MRIRGALGVLCILPELVWGTPTLLSHTAGCALSTGSGESWGWASPPPPTLPSCWWLSQCLHPAGKSSVGLVSQGSQASGCGVSLGETGKCWGSRVALCFHQFSTTSNHFPTPGLMVHLSVTSQAEPILCPRSAPLLPSPPTSCFFALPAAPGGLVAGVTQAAGRGRPAGLPGFPGPPCLLFCVVPF